MSNSTIFHPNLPTFLQIGLTATFWTEICIFMIVLTKIKSESRTKTYEVTWPEAYFKHDNTKLEAQVSLYRSPDINKSS